LHNNSLILSEINLDLGATVQQPIAPSTAGSAPNRDKYKYPVDDIKDPTTPCTLKHVKGRTSRTIEVAEANVMPNHIHHGQPILAECAVLEVTTI
jgi:F0F1-type ATP synthase beta subunit